MIPRAFWSGAVVGVFAAACSGCCCLNGGGLCGCSTCCGPCDFWPSGGTYSGACCTSSGDECCISDCGDCCADCTTTCCDDGCCEFGAGGFRWGWNPDCGWADMRYGRKGYHGCVPGGGPIRSVFNLVAHVLHCGSGCGAIYYDEWVNDPPVCSDPCGYDGGIGSPSCCTCSHCVGSGAHAYAKAQPGYRWSKKTPHVTSYSGSHRVEDKHRFRDGYSGEVYYEDDYEKRGQSQASRSKHVGQRPSRGTRVVRTSAEDRRYR